MGAFLLSMLAFVGCCFIAGALTRNTDGTGKDKDHPIITFMRGLAVVAYSLCYWTNTWNIVIIY